MNRTNLKVAIRALKKNKLFAAINIAGLALSLACIILIFTLVKYHLGFDTFHADSDRIYRLVTEQHRDNISYVGHVPNPLGKAIRTDHSFAEEVARIASFDGMQITVETAGEQKKFKEPEGLAFAESSFFRIFNYPLIQGNPKTALEELNTVIITERLAKKYFGTTDVLNKMIRADNRLDLKITGVLKDLPENTDAKIELYASYITVKDFEPWYYDDNSWGGISSSMQCFVKLKPGVTPASVEAVLPAYVKKYRAESKNVHHYKLQPLAEMHFDSRYGGAMQKRNIWVLSLIGLFLLVTACVNFVNLATAQALKRSKEVGVRKVIGSRAPQIFWQFISETALISSIATVLAIGLAYLALPQMNSWFKTKVTLDFFTDPYLSGFIFLLLVAVTFLAGSYPGLVLAGFKPLQAIKGKITQQQVGGFNTRRSLIVAQFAISQLLLIGMIVISSQMRYAQDADLGFHKEQIVMLPVGPQPTISKMNMVSAAIAKVAGVQDVSLCFAPPASDQSWNNSVRYDNRPENEVFPVSIRSADSRYLPTFDLEILAGRNIQPSDTANELVVNEAFARKLNLPNPEAVIGKTLSLNAGQTAAPIVGVVKDFHQGSFRSDINALCIGALAENYQYFAVRLNGPGIKQTMAGIEKTWTGFYPDLVYEYEFLDESIARFYEAEQTILKLVRLFALIAIFIGCLGIYGLVSFMAAQKTKEIGIRKVLGGSVSHILWIFGREFSLLIGLALFIAGPIAWYLMNQWLLDFKYRISISPWYFVFTVLLTAAVAMLAGSWQAVRAANAKPMKNLKSE